MIRADFYCLWKDPDCEGKHPEWENMTRKEYQAWINDPDPEKRKANRARRMLYVGDGKGKSNAMEATVEQCREWDADRKRASRAEKARKQNELSLDQLCETGEPEFLSSARNIDEEEIAWLHEAVDRLPEYERKIIRLMYFDSPEVKSQVEIERETCIPRSTVQYVLRRAYGRLRADYLRTFTRLTGEN